MYSAGARDTRQFAAEVSSTSVFNEISHIGELDLHKHFNNCSKNRGHHDFIPVSRFSENDLPVGHRTASNYASVNYLAKLTVKISVEFVSPHRPPGYALSDLGNQCVLTVGSGYLSHMLGQSSGRFPCPIENCSKYAGLHDVFGYFSIFTAAHVDYDDLEAKNTSVEFFYDDAVNKAGVKRAEGVRVGAKSAEGDFTELICVTHDESLFNDVTLLLLGSDTTFSLRMTRLMAELKPHSWSNRVWANALAEKVNRMFSPVISNERLLSSMLELEEFMADSLLNDIFCVLTSTREHCERRAGGSDPFEYFMNYFNRELKGMIANGVDALLTFYKESLMVGRQEITVSGTSGMDELTEAVVVLKKCEILFQNRRRSHKSRDEQTLPDLHQFFSQFDSFIKGKMFLVNTLSEHHPPSALHPIIIAISHPHGQSKHVTFGNYLSCNTANGFYTHIYNASTCNGSSGAPVWVIPSEDKKATEEVYAVLHKGPHANSHAIQLNEGSAWTVYPPFRDRLCIKQESCCRLLLAFVAFLDSSSKLTDAYVGRQLDSDPAFERGSIAPAEDQSEDTGARALGYLVRTVTTFAQEAFQPLVEPRLDLSVNGVISYCARSAFSYVADKIFQNN